MLECLLLIGADFNFVDADGRVKASLRFATTPEIPTIGEWVRLEDVDGNCLALVEEVKSPVIAARPVFATWRHCDVRLGS